MPAASATVLWPRPAYNAHASTRHLAVSPFIRDSNQVDLPMSFPMDVGMLRRKISEDAVDSHTIPTNPFEMDRTIHSPIDIPTDVVNRNSHEGMRLIECGNDEDHAKLLSIDIGNKYKCRDAMAKTCTCPSTTHHDGPPHSYATPTK